MFLLIHGSLKLLLKEYEFMRDDVTIQTIGIAVYEARPRLVLCGQMHIENPYTANTCEYWTLYTRVDSSQRHRVYLILYIR